MPERTWLRSMGALLVAQAVNIVLPLATVPFLARVLGANEWGAVALAQALAVYVALVVDYAFGMSATREAARLRDDPTALGRLAAGVLGAKALLVLPVLALAVIAAMVLPSATIPPALLCAAVAWGLAQGMHPGWLLQGLERMGTVAAIEVVTKGAATLATLLLVRGPGDGWIALACGAGGWVAASAIASVVAYRIVPLQRPTLALARAQLSDGRRLFGYRAALSLYSSANVLLLGMLAPAAAVAYYAGAEKVVRAPLNVLWPAVQALYPHISRLSVGDPAAARRTVLRVLMIATIAALAGAIALAALAPLIVRILLGPGYEPAADVLRVMALLLPLITASSLLGTQVLLPAKRDGVFTRIALGAGAVNIVVALALTPTLHHLGMAAAVVSAEIVVLAAQLRAAWPLLHPPLARGIPSCAS